MGLCLVAGATGYIGARLVPHLLDAGHQVRCLSRSASRLHDAPWGRRVEIAEGDLLEPEAVRAALRGVDVAYYLVHSLGAAAFEQADRRAAGNFAREAKAAGVRRIVYLGGPEPGGGVVSAHLRSRAEVGRILASSGVPTVILRAAVVIGSGSASFEMLRYLTENLPVVVTPRWVRNRLQPIAISDVLRYLAAFAQVSEVVDRPFDIGGPDVLTYQDMMIRYARVARLPRRLIMPVRQLSPRLSALWVGLVTPVPNAIARPLVASLIHEAVVHEHDIAEYVPDPPQGLLGFDDAVRLARAGLDRPDFQVERPASQWSDDAAGPLPSDPAWSGGSRYLDERCRDVDAPADVLWWVIEGVGDRVGWYSPPPAWSARRWLDTFVGSVGQGKGHPRRLKVGDLLDFWRVEQIEPGRLLRLRAELRLPGRAWLEMRVIPDGAGSRYEQRVLFIPKGLSGHVYWKGVSLANALFFGRMASDVVTAAQRLARRRVDRQSRALAQG